VSGSPDSLVQRVSVVIPAHDEERSISRLLEALLAGSGPQLDVLVVCNGCTDATAAVARSTGPSVRVLELPEPGKPAALRAGIAAARHPTLVLADADVVIGSVDLAALCAELSRDGVLASGPERVLDLTGVSWPVRWYYDVWERLPQVRTGLFGRGVIAVSPEGLARLKSLPEVMSDDLVASEAFGPTERVVVAQARVVIRPPRTMRDLMRRRVRVVTGNAQADASGLRGEEARTSLRDLMSLVGANPLLAPRVTLFAAVALGARVRARRAVARGDYTTWLRDESSRS
jgi:glycosyltransferase involved in cell wall biosynthesis